MKKIYIPQGGGRDFWLRIPMNNESAGRHLCMDDVDENDMHVWLESGYGGCWTLVWEKDGAQRDGIAAKVPASFLGYGTYSVVMAGKFVNGDSFRTKRQLFIRLVDREDQADAEPTMYNEEQAYWAGPAVLSEMLSRDGLNTYELWILQGNEGSLEDYLSVSGLTLNDFMVRWNHLSVEVQSKIDRAEQTSINPKGDYDEEVEYHANDLVYDSETLSSYVSLLSHNTGNPVTDTTYWMKVLDGDDINQIKQDAEDEIDEALQDARTATTNAVSATTAAEAVVAQKVADAQIGYYECNTAAGTATKATTTNTIGQSTFAVPVKGCIVKIKMTNANTATDTVYLQFGSDANTKKELKYNGLAVDASNSWEEGETISVFYDGTYYQASNAQGGGGKAEKIKYDNTESGLEAENVQDAIDEQSAEITDSLATFTEMNLGSLSNSAGFALHNDSLGGDAWLWHETRVRTHKVFPRTSDMISVKVTANADKNATVIFLTANDVVTTNGQAISMCSGWTLARGNVNAGTTRLFKIPSDCTYIAVNNIYTASTTPADYLPVFFAIGEPLKNKVDDNTNAIIANTGDITEIKDILANCYHQTSGSETTNVYLTGASFVNQNPKYNASYNNRLIQAKNDLISVVNKSEVVLNIPASAVSSPITLGTIELFDEDKTWLESLDLGWQDLGSTDVEITIDLTEQTYKRVKYVGAYFGGASGTSISASNLNLSNIYFAVTAASTYTTKAVDETQLQELEDSLDVRSQYSYVGEKISVKNNKFDVEVLFSMTNNNKAVQAAAIYGDFLFQGFNTNPFIEVWNIRTKSLLQTLNLTEDSNNHFAGAAFGKFYDQSDPLPLLYVAAFNSPYIYVYRFGGSISSSASNLTISLVQTITLDISSYMYLPIMAIDRENGKMIVYGYKLNSYQTASGNEMRFAYLDIPTTNGDMVLTESDFTKKFSLPFRWAQQGGVAQYGKFYFCWGYAASQLGCGMMQIDYMNGVLLSEADLMSVMNNTDEPQGMGIWEDGIVVTSYLRYVRKFLF